MKVMSHKSPNQVESIHTLNMYLRIIQTERWCDADRLMIVRKKYRYSRRLMRTGHDQ